MKLKYLFFAALASLGFTACSDFLDVDSVSKGFSAKRQRLTAPLTGYMQS